MTKEDFESLQRGLAEAKAYLDGERKGFASTSPSTSAPRRPRPAPDMKLARDRKVENS